MSEQKNEVKLEDIVSLCKRRGFIFQGSDIYGGLAGTWDYGPLGLALKKNIMNLWWRMFVEERDDMYGVDAAILMNQKVWQASGHTATFSDPMIECMNCHERYREDKFMQNIPQSQEDTLWLQLWVDNYRAIKGYDDQDDLGKAVKARSESIAAGKNVCPNCRKPAEYSEPERFNMMLKTVMGPRYSSWDRKKPGGLEAHVVFKNEEGNTEREFDLKDTFNELGGFMFYNSTDVSYLRPETAQGIFTNFKNVVDTFYPDVPFGIAQQGKAFRNEISPRDFVFRSREFEQMEIEYFVHPDKWKAAFEQWRKDIEAFLQALGLPAAKVEEIEVPEADRAHYSKRTIDYEYAFPHGKDELLGLAYRTDFDLGNIQRVSGKSMEYRPKDGSAPYVPHVIEPSFGVERAVMAVLTSAYWHDTENERVVLKLPYALAPVKVAVCPLAKNNEALVAKAREVYDMLRREFGQVLWIDSGNIGKNYRKMDEIGVPYVVTVDFETLEGDTKDTVTVRHRDTTEQERMNVASLAEKLGNN